MEPEKPDKPQVKPGTGVAVTDEPEPDFKENIKQELDLLKQKVQKDALKEELENLKDPTRTQLYKSMFRVKHEPTPRARSLGVLTNVFLHLHPAKINRDASASATRGGWGG